MSESGKNSGGCFSGITQTLGIVLLTYIIVAYVNVVLPNYDLIDTRSNTDFAKQIFWLNDFAIFELIYVSIQIVLTVGGVSALICCQAEACAAGFLIVYVFSVLVGIGFCSWFMNRGLYIQHSLNNECGIIHYSNETYTISSTCNLYNSWYNPIFIIFSITFIFSNINLICLVCIGCIKKHDK